MRTTARRARRGEPTLVPASIRPRWTGRPGTALPPEPATAGLVRVRVHYPIGADGRIRLRCDRDWERSIAPVREAPHAGLVEFELELGGRHAYFKPVLEAADSVRWAQGSDLLALPGSALDVHPHFAPPVAAPLETHRVACERGDRAHDVHVLLPPGYHENHLARYRVLCMQDGQNLFSPERAFAGQHWRVGEALTTLRAMSAATDCIVVGVEPRVREVDYTSTGYEAYGEYLVRALEPWLAARYRTLRGPEHTAVVGSSLGGVVSLFLGLRWPDVFGSVVCMSSTFGWRDDLAARVGSAARLPSRVYLDSGWPDDNYEVTRTMAARLRARGLGASELLYLAFPHARHTETAWAERLHVPLQFVLGAPAASRREPCAPVPRP